MRFIDQASIAVEAGKGGPGSRHFRREKHVPRGGPDGGDGGRGGDVVMVASERARSLLDYHHRRLHKAEPGQPGGEKRSTGRSGQDLELIVPVGTQIFDEASGETLADLTEDGMRVVVAAGGIGGRGNYQFRTSTRQAPERADLGRPGQSRSLRMELKLLADVGLVGLPNAGKSTLIRQVSASRARVADYPFTTLVPNLGVVRHRGRVFTIADIPGLVRGAADGAGLGTQFLRHVERCHAFVFVLALDGDPAPAEALEVLRGELAAYDADLASRPALVALNKTDLLGASADGAASELAAATGGSVYAISALTGHGVGEVMDALLSLLDAQPAPEEHWDPAG